MFGKISNNPIVTNQGVRLQRSNSMTTPIARNLMLKNAPTLPGSLRAPLSPMKDGDTKSVNPREHEDEFDIETNDDTEFGSEDYEAELEGVVRNDAKPTKGKSDYDFSSESDDETDDDTFEVGKNLKNQVDEESKTKRKLEKKEASTDVGLQGRGRSKSEPTKVVRNNEDDIFSDIIDEDDEEAFDHQETGKVDVQPQQLGRSSSKDVALTESKKSNDMPEETESDTTEDENVLKQNAQPKKERHEEVFERAEQLQARSEVKADDETSVVVEKEIPELQDFEARDLGNIEAGIGLRDGGKIRSDDVKKPFKERVLEKLSGIVSKLKTGLDSIRFAMKDFFIEEAMSNPSSNSREARLDRKHAFLEKSGFEIKNVFDVDAMEAFLNIGWSGDSHGDSKIFHKFSNMLTKLEASARSKYESETKTFNSAKNELLKLRETQKDLRDSIEQLKTKVRDAKTEIDRNQHIQEVEKKIGDLHKCHDEIKNKMSFIENFNLQQYHPDNIRQQNARTLVQRASELHLSEVSWDELNTLAEKFESERHDSKASFVRMVMSEILNREIKSSPEQLKQMRRDRDEEIELNAKPKLDYTTSGALENFKVRVTDERIDEKLSESAKIARRKEIEEKKALNVEKDLPQVSVNMRKMLADIKSEYEAVRQQPGAPTFEKFRDDRVYDMVKKASSIQLKDFNGDAIGEIVKALRKTHPDRAELLEKVAERVAYIQSPAGLDEIYRPVAMNGLAESKDPNTFLRAANDPLAVAMATLMNSAGMEKFRGQVLGLAMEFAKELEQSEGIQTLAQKIEKEEVVSWGNGMTEGVAREIAKIAIRFQERLGELDLDEGVIRLFGEFSQQFLGRETVGEDVPRDQRGNGLTESDKDEFVHKIFADQLFLKVINPALTNGLAVANINKEISKPIVRVITLMATFTQDSANQSSLIDPKKSVIDPYPNVIVTGPRAQFQSDIFDLSVQLAGLQDQMFIKAGMRPQATSKNILDLPDIN